MNAFKLTVLLLLSLVVVFNSCKKETDTGDGEKPLGPTTPYDLEYPHYFPHAEIPEDNPLTEEGVALGKRLYYDKLLSQGGPMNGLSCSSCHLQEYGFTVPNSNVLAHVNLAWNTNFLWEGKVSGTLEDVMMFEVNDFFQTDVALLNKDKVYARLFKQVFGKNKIDDKQVAYALSQFARSLVSSNAKFDQYVRHELTLTEEEMRGFVIFNSEKGDCFHCHGGPLFTDNDFHNIGLESTFVGDDMGLYNVTADPNDLGRFKTPTLRNAALKSSFMHDGRFSTLEEVIEHYNSGVKHSPSLDPIMTKPGTITDMELTEQDKSDLVAFLKTLTDNEFLENPEHGNPW